MIAADPDLAIFKLAEQRKTQPFVWGQRDCFLWVADVVLALTGRDIAEDVRGQYASAQTAAVLLRHRGGLRALAMRAGQHVPDLADLRAGDVALLKADFIDVDCDAGRHMGALAVCWRDKLVGQAERGLAILPLRAALAAWRPLP